MGEAGKYNIFYISKQPLYSEQEINELNEHINNCKIRQEREGAAAIGANKKSRVSVVTWSEVNKQLKKLETLLFNVNSKYFKYDLVSIDDTHLVNINDYDSNNPSYDWHIDCNHYPSKYDIKLTCLLNLSSKKYEGGELLLSGTAKKEKELIDNQFGKPGYVLIFTAYRQHMVTPVIKGTRRTLSYWSRGPAWR